MGAWGTAIFSNDTSADVRGDFRELIEDGLSDQAATAEILERYREVASDADEATAFWTGLAAVQSRLGRLQFEVRDRAIALIDGGGDIHLWKSSSDEGRRRAALSKLKDELLGPQRAPIKLKRPRPIPSPVETGQLIGLPLDDGREARLRVIGMKEHRLGRFPIVELVDDRGNTFKRFSIRKQWDDLARFEVVSARLKDVPKDLHVLEGQFVVPPDARVWYYTSWANLRRTCARLLDTPDAAPG